MSRIEINIPSDANKNIAPPENTGNLPRNRAGQKSAFRTLLKLFGITMFIVVILIAVGGFVFWQNLKTTPQYSLALLIEAARNNDQETIDKLVDTDAVVDDFLPQITKKAVELYGRGLPAEKISRITSVLGPILPAVKDRAREELPDLIREKTEKFSHVPFWAIAAGSGSYLDISVSGEIASVKSNIPEKEIELTLRKNGEYWQLVAVEDEALAARIAESVGEEIIAAARKTGVDQLRKTGESLGLENVKDILKKAEEIFK